MQKIYVFLKQSIHEVGFEHRLHERCITLVVGSVNVQLLTLEEHGKSCVGMSRVDCYLHGNVQCSVTKLEIRRESGDTDVIFYSSIATLYSCRVLEIVLFVLTSFVLNILLICTLFCTLRCVRGLYFQKCLRLCFLPAIAIMNGVFPSLSVALILAPSFSKHSIVSCRPCCVATWRAVPPLACKPKILILQN